MDGVEYDTEEDEIRAEEIGAAIAGEVAMQPAYVRGCDKERRALLILHSRTCQNTDEDAFVLAQIYLMERAIAASEFGSEGRVEKITGVFDFGTFQSSLAPPLNAVKAVCSILQNRYSERLQKLIIIDPPFWMRTMFGLLKPFLDPVTSAKFIVATGQKRKQDVVAELVDEDQAMPFLLPSGKLNDEVDLGVFTRHVPFHCGYDKSYGLFRTEIGRTESGTSICSGSFEDGRVSLVVR